MVGLIAPIATISHPSEWPAPRVRIARLTVTSTATHAMIENKNGAERDRATAPAFPSAGADDVVHARADGVGEDEGAGDHRHAEDGRAR